MKTIKSIFRLIFVTIAFIFLIPAMIAMIILAGPRLYLMARKRREQARKSSLDPETLEYLEYIKKHKRLFKSPRSDIMKDSQELKKYTEKLKKILRAGDINELHERAEKDN